MKPLFAVLLAAAVAGCSDQSMTRQPHYGTNAPAPAFANGSAAQQPPAGTVAEEDAAFRREEMNPPPVDIALLQRGKERFGIFCAPCHGYEGDGDGAIVRRGFPHPPSYYSPALMQASGRFIFDVVTNGYGIMYSYGSRVPPHDRWAIVAYIRALQQSRSATLAEAPQDSGDSRPSPGNSAMSAPGAESDRFDPAAPNALLLFGLAAAAALGVAAFLAPRAAAWGWLVGFVFWSSFPIGTIVLSLIHQTTGGRWGLAAAPTLRLCAPLLILYFAFLFAGLHALYPWANGGAGTAPDVARLFLNAPAFAALGFVAILVWAAIGLLIAVGRLGLLATAVALVFHGLAVSLIAVDWMLSIDPRFSDSAFGAEIAVQQILVALAAIAVFQPRRAVAIADGDIGGLMLAAALGAFYLGLMTFIVKWYGDQPVDAAWYLARAHGARLGFLAGAVLLGAVAPVVGCAWERVRGSPPAMRAVGISTLVGVALHDLWLAGPAAPALGAPAALIAVIAMAGISAGLAPRLDRRLMRRATADGMRP